MRARAAARGGFTVIEVLIVLAIILMISGLVAISLFGRRDQADIDVTKVNMNTLRSALDAFRFDMRRYPTDEEGVAVLWDREQLDPEADGTKWTQYLSKPMPNDQWGNPWGYSQESEDFESDEENASAVAPYDLWSNGPDGEEGTDDDIRLGGSGATGDDADEFGGDLVPSSEP